MREEREGKEGGREGGREGGKGGREEGMGKYVRQKDKRERKGSKKKQ